MLPAHIHSLILDMDGVLWRDNTAIGDLREIFSIIRKKGVQYSFATNNSMRTPESYVERLASFGISADLWQIVTSSIVTADLLLQKIPTGKGIYVVGGEGIKKAVEEKGYKVLPVEKADEASAVVMGIDTEINFSKMAEASLLVQKGLPFIGTNPDKTFPTPRGQIPGAGAWVSVIETATGVQPIFAGKPSPQILEYGLKKLGSKKEETLVVGDRLETDIAAAQAGGFPCCLVLSGVSTIDEGKAWSPKIDIIARDLFELIS